MPKNINKKVEKEKDKKKDKLLFILKKRGYGNSYKPSFGLINSVKFVVQALEEYGFDCKVVEVVDSNRIDKEVHDFNPDFVFIEALFVPPYKIRELLEKYKKKKISWNVRIHSNIPFLQMEGIAIEWLKEYAKINKKYNNFTISGNNKKQLTELCLGANIELKYTPNIYLFQNKSYIKPYNKKEIHIACLGALRPLKNVLEQACAAISFANNRKLKLFFYINSDRNEQFGENVLKNLKFLFKDTTHSLVLNPWLNHNDLIKLLDKIDLGMSVSFTESFSLQSADYISQNIPVVTSKEVQFVLPAFQVETTDIENIIKKLDFAYKMKWTGIHNLNKILLNKHNNNAIKAWLDFLNYNN